MKVLYVITKDLDATGKAIRDVHTRDNEVQTLDLRVEKDYGKVVDAIAAADRVISW